MLELLKFIFSDFFYFIGTLILLSSIGNLLVEIIAQILNRKK